MTINKEQAVSDAVERGCRCQVCGRHYRVDVMVPDDLWNAIRPAGREGDGGLLCGSCIISRLEEARGFSAFRLAHPLEQQHTASEAVKRIRDSVTEEQMVAGEREYYRRTGDSFSGITLMCIYAEMRVLEQQQAVSDVVERIREALNGLSQLEEQRVRAALTASGMGRMREAQDRRNDLLRRLMSDVGGCFTYAEDAVREAIGNTNYSVIMQWVEEARTALQEDGRDDGAA